MKHIFHLTFALLAGMALCACSSDDPMDNDQAAVPVQPGEAGSDDTWGVKIEGDMTRGLSLSGTTLTPNFNGETIYVYYGGTNVGTLKAPSGNLTGDRTPTGRLNNATYTVGQNLSLYFLKDKGFSTYTGQKGTIADIAANFDYATATAQITDVDVNTHTLTISKATFTSQQAIIGFKFNEDLASGEVITIRKTNASGDVLAVVSSSPKVDKNSTVVYVALPLTNTLTNYTLYFDITKSSKPHAIGTLALTDENRKMKNGQYYSPQTVSLTHHMSYATADDVTAHKGINSSGYIVNLTSSCVAMIAYVNGSTRIALSKADAPGQGTTNYYKDAATLAAKTAPTTLPSGTSGWKVPTIDEWSNVLKGVTGQSAELTESENPKYANVDPDGTNNVVSSLNKMYWSTSASNQSGKNWAYRAQKGTKNAQGTSATGDYGKNDYVRAIFTINNHP